jgi:hypothetical protein
MYGLYAIRKQKGGILKSVKFDNPGLMTLPGYMHLTCYSNRTCQVSRSSVINVSPNQAAVFSDGALTGLLLEEKRTNLALNGLASGFSSTNNGNGTLTTGRTDPVNETNAWRYQTSAGGFGINQTIVPVAAHVMSAWLKTNSTNSYATLLENTVKDAGIVVADTAGIWKRYSYIGSVIPAGATVIGDCRDAYSSYSGSADADYAFIQTENGSYPTSYIPTTTSTVTRNATVLTVDLLSATSLDISIKNTKVCNLQACSDHPYVMSNYVGDQTFIVQTNKTFTNMSITVGSETKATDFLYNWVVGDVFESHTQAHNVGNKAIVNVTVKKNGVLVGTESFTFSTPLNFVSQRIVIGSDYLGAHQFCGVLQSIQGSFGGGLGAEYTEYDFAVSSRGAGVLPSDLTFTCASTRTCQTTANTIVTGIGSNVPAFDITGLLHEVQSTNHCQYSENFSSWGAASTSGIESLSQTDPAGTTTAIKYANAQGRGRYSSVSVALSTNATLSAWINNTDTTNAANVCFRGLPNTFAVTIPNNKWGRFSARNTSSSIGALVVVAEAEFAPYNNISQNASFAFVQVESVPYMTSYIPNTGSSTTTRAGSKISKTFKSATKQYLDFTFTAATSPANMAGTFGIIMTGGGGNYIALMPDGRFTYSQSFYTTKSFTWSENDVVRIVVDNSNVISITVYVNGVKTGSDTINYTPSWSSSATFTLFGPNTLSDPYYLPIRGLRKMVTR